MSGRLTDQAIAYAVVDAIRSVVGDVPAALHEPRFHGNEWGYLKECLDSTFVSSVGSYVDRFESELASFTGARHAVAVVNGTAALHLSLLLAGVGPGDEVLVPALTFVATANAVTYCGAVAHFADVEERTLGIDPFALREYLYASTEARAGQCVNRVTGRVIRALVPMHTFGHPADMEGLLAVAHDFNLALVEDAAESLGSYYQGRHTGTIGVLGTLSFNGNKTITTGGGGAILTNDPDLADRAKHLSTTAKRSHGWSVDHDEVGYNYRLPNLNAALGCAQMEQLHGFLADKRRLYDRYAAALNTVSGAWLFREPDGCRSNYWLQTLLLEARCADARDSVLAAVNDAGYSARPIWTPLNRLKPFRSCPHMELPVTDSLERRVVNLPSGASLGA